MGWIYLKQSIDTFIRLAIEAKSNDQLFELWLYSIDSYYKVLLKIEVNDA